MNADELRKRFPWASDSFIKANADSAGVCSQEPERLARVSLERTAPREEAGGDRPETRYRITFRCFARRPCDYDNYRVKECQDMVVKAGLIPDDNWRVLEGCVVSRKAKTKAEERTIIEIEPLPS